MGDSIPCWTHQRCLHVRTAKKGLTTNRQTMTEEIHRRGSFNMYEHKTSKQRETRMGGKHVEGTIASALVGPFRAPSPHQGEHQAGVQHRASRCEDRSPLRSGLLRGLQTLTMPDPQCGHPPQLWLPLFPVSDIPALFTFQPSFGHSSVTNPPALSPVTVNTVYYCSQPAAARLR